MTKAKTKAKPPNGKGSQTLATEQPGDSSTNGSEKGESPAQPVEPPQSDSSSSPNAPTDAAPAPLTPALDVAASILSEASAAGTGVGTAPTGATAPSADTETRTTADLLSSAASLPPSTGASEPMKRRGGWPKGRPRGKAGETTAGTQSATSFAHRNTGATGATAEARALAAAHARIAELEAQQSTAVREALTQGFAQLARIGFGFMAQRKGAHWRLTAEEAAELGQAATTCALPYIGYVAPALPFIALAGAVYTTCAPRMEMDDLIAAGKVTQVFPAKPTADA